MPATMKYAVLCNKDKNKQNSAIKKKKKSSFVIYTHTAYYYAQRKSKVTRLNNSCVLSIFISTETPRKTTIKYAIQRNKNKSKQGSAKTDLYLRKIYSTRAVWD